MLELLNKTLLFLNSEDGPTAVEYAIMLALIIIVCLLAIGVVGMRTNQMFNTVGNVLPNGS